MRKAAWLWTLLLIAAAGAAQAKSAKTQDLPDSAFASVERGPDGKKVRRLPYRDAAGKLDAARLRASLRLWKRTKWEDQAHAQPALAVLQRAKSELCAAGRMKCGKARSRKAAKA